MLVPQWLPWVLAALVVAGGATTGALIATSGSSDSSDSASESPGGPPGAKESDDDASAPDSPSSDSPGSPESPDSPDSSDSLPGDEDVSPDADDLTTPEEEPPSDPDAGDPEPSVSAEGASGVVKEYYQYLNDQDYRSAWDLGGKNIAGTTYEKWVDGFDTTAIIELSAVDTESNGEVSAVLYATQTDGTVNTYQGTYTVEDGVIVSADITES